MGCPEQKNLPRRLHPWAYRSRHTGTGDLRCFGKICYLLNAYALPTDFLEKCPFPMERLKASAVVTPDRGSRTWYLMLEGSWRHGRYRDVKGCPGGGGLWRLCMLQVQSLTSNEFVGWQNDFHLSRSASRISVGQVSVFRVFAYRIFWSSFFWLSIFFLFLSSFVGLSWNFQATNNLSTLTWSWWLTYLRSLRTPNLPKLLVRKQNVGSRADSEPYCFLYGGDVHDWNRTVERD